MSTLGPGRWFLLALFASMGLGSLAGGRMVRRSAPSDELPSADNASLCPPSEEGEALRELTAERDRLQKVRAELDRAD